MIQDLNRATVDVKIVPRALKTLATEKNQLVKDKETILNQLLKEKIQPKVDRAEKEEMKALTMLSAAMVMRGDRLIHNAYPENVLNYLGRNRDLQALMHEEFHKLEKTLNFDKV